MNIIKVTERNGKANDLLVLRYWIQQELFGADPEEIRYRSDFVDQKLAWIQNFVLQFVDHYEHMPTYVKSNFECYDGHLCLEIRGGIIE